VTDQVSHPYKTTGKTIETNIGNCNYLHHILVKFQNYIKNFESNISENAIVLIYSKSFEHIVLCQLAASRVGVEQVSVCVEVGMLIGWSS
jgi:IMP cyclohydrolase